MSAVVDFPVKPEARPYLDAFAPDAGEPQWLAGQRRRGLNRFAELGFPSRRSESWRYLDLSALAGAPLLPRAAAGGTVPAPDSALAGGSDHLVLVDGHFAPELSSCAPPPGVWLGSMARALVERADLLRPTELVADAESSLAALNGALFADGFVLAVAPGVTLARPVEIVHVASGAAPGSTQGGSMHTRSLVALGAKSRASVLETYSGADEGAYWRNDVVEIRLADGAHLTRVALVEEGAQAIHIGETVATLGPSAELAAFVLLLGGRIVRHEANVLVGGENARCRLDGAFLIGGRQQANIVATVDHAAPGGQTRELVKGVAGGHAQGAFQGRMIVRKGAQKVDAQQTSRNLLLSRGAVINTKPELEILADDVKCSHGATVGDLDEAQMFYLQSRGLPRPEARRLLVEAFLRDAVERIEPAALRDHLLGRLGRRLGAVEA
jgi:Fe-S cluster assembly protein SufD